MGWQLTDDVDAFLAVAGPMLAADRARSTVVLTVARTLQESGPRAFGGGAPIFGWAAEADGTVSAAFLQSPPWPLALTAMTDAQAQALVQTLATTGRTIPGASGPAPAARAVAQAWAARTGGEVRVRREERLHRLGTLVPPDPAPPGGPRVPDAGDRELLVAWWTAFAVQVRGEPSASGGQVADRLSYGGLLLWEVDGEPVSLAGRSRVVAGMARVGPVFTPGPLRGRGYAAAVTHEVSRRTVSAGADEVVLFTDVTNSTSNGLYRRLGYVPTGEHLLLDFGALQG